MLRRVDSIRPEAQSGIRRQNVFDFDAFADLTDSFNTAIHGGASLAASALAVSTVFDLASARSKPDQDPELKAPKAALKMSLLGMMM